MTNISWKSPEHRQRFVTAMRQIGKIDAGKFDPEYAAALYILTVDYATWDKPNGYVKRTGIDMDAILHASIFSSGETVLVLLAWNLFNEGQSVNPIEQMPNVYNNQGVKK